MKKKIIILIVILVVVIGGIIGFLSYQKNKSIEICKKRCIYRPESVGILTKKGWNYEGRVFETQEQCIDYCLINK